MSSLILLDTSVWIESFRKRNPLHLEKIIEFDQIVTCLPVIQEVLQGFRDEDAFRVAHDAMLSLPVVESPLSIALVEEAVVLYRTARRLGLTVRSSVDCLIAACALRHGLTVMHRDRDYPQLARVSSLQQHMV
jgi:predicted nucleic acid-binding protein